MNLLKFIGSCRSIAVFFTSEANMKLMTFLADVLFCFSRFQQCLQKDSLRQQSYLLLMSYIVYI